MSYTITFIVGMICGATLLMVIACLANSDN